MLAAIVLSVSSMVSCSKSDNDTNNSSTDSVLYSAWIPLNLVITQPTSDSIYEQKLTANALTKSVLSKGVVNVYLNYTGSGGTQVALPSDAGIYPTFTTGAIYLDAYGSNGALMAQNLYFDSVRYVIIPGKISTTSANGSVQNYTPAQLNHMDYSTLTRVLGIPPAARRSSNNWSCSIMTGLWPGYFYIRPREWNPRLFRLYFILADLFHLYLFHQPVSGVDLKTLDRSICKVADNECQPAGALRVSQFELPVELLVGKNTLVELISQFIQDRDAKTAAGGIVVQHIVQKVPILTDEVVYLGRGFGDAISVADRPIAVSEGDRADTPKQDDQKECGDRLM